MADRLRVTDSELAGGAVIYLRVGNSRLAFEARELRALVKDRAVMCGWLRDGITAECKEGDGWLIPGHFALWYADRHKIGNEVFDRDAHQQRVRDSQIDWWKEYDSPRG